MKKFDSFMVTVLVMIFSVTVIINFVISGTGINGSKLYKVEINRIEQELMDDNEINADNYDTIIDIYQYKSDENFYNSPNEYVIREINGTLFRIEYNDEIGNSNLKLTVNIVLVILFLFVLSIISNSFKFLPYIFVFKLSVQLFCNMLTSMILLYIKNLLYQYNINNLLDIFY